MSAQTAEANPNFAMKREAGTPSDAPPSKARDKRAGGVATDDARSVKGCPLYPDPCPSWHENDYEAKSLRRCRHLCRGLAFSEISRLENEERNAARVQRARYKEKS